VQNLATIFRLHLPLSHPCFETEQRLENLQCTLGASMTGYVLSIFGTVRPGQVEKIYEDSGDLLNHL